MLTLAEHNATVAAARAAHDTARATGNYERTRWAQAEETLAVEARDAFRYGPVPADAQFQRDAARRAAGIKCVPCIAF